MSVSPLFRGEADFASFLGVPAEPSDRVCANNIEEDVRDGGQETTQLVSCYSSHGDDGR